MQRPDVEAHHGQDLAIGNQQLGVAVGKGSRVVGDLDLPAPRRVCERHPGRNQGAGCPVYLCAPFQGAGQRKVAQGDAHRDAIRVALWLSLHLRIELCDRLGQHPPRFLPGLSSHSITASSTSRRAEAICAARPS
ncbi:hypothetical protein ACFSC4_07065 [Deinococcus malanensis]|uniref:hypothetical protein n=1 Tax=Deinococcus malanensis TaxID=1706855 RepID=UPI00362FBB8C